MPLFLDEDFGIHVPLKETYQTTWNVLPAEIQQLLEPPAPAQAAKRAWGRPSCLLLLANRKVCPTLDLDALATSIVVDQLHAPRALLL
jgi:hypothetical protein